MLVVGAFLATPAAAAKPKLPKDACALVSDDDVAALVEGTTPVPTKSAKGVRCNWSATNGTAGLTVTIVKNRGVTEQILKSTAEAEGGSTVGKLGTFATQHSVNEQNTQVQVLFRNLVIQVSFDTSERDVTTAEEAATLDVARTVVKEL